MWLYYKICLLILLIFISFTIIYLGYNENIKNYITIYKSCQGEIIDKKIESVDSIEKDTQENVIKHKKKFRLCVKYKYYVDGKEYEGYIYNDGKNDNFMSSEDYISLRKKYDNIKFLMIYHHNTQHHKNFYNFENIIVKRKKMFYFFGYGLLLIPFIIFC